MSLYCAQWRKTGLENRRPLTGTVSSNLTLSAKSKLVSSTKSRGAILDARSALVGRGPGWPESQPGGSRVGRCSEAATVRSEAEDERRPPRAISPSPPIYGG